MNRFDHYRVFSFDCYGTLIDWETGLWEALQPLLLWNRGEIDRTELLAAFGRLETEHEANTPALPYPQILTRVHRDLAARFEWETTEEMNRTFAASVRSWPAFPDSADALARLARRFQLVILSNVDRAGFEGSRRHLGDHFAAVYTAEDIGSYKPDPTNFDYLLEHLHRELGVEPDRVLHVAQSLFHDHAPAKAVGLDTVWIDRRRLSEGGDWGATAPLDDPPLPDHVFFTLSELANAAEAS